MGVFFTRQKPEETHALRKAFRKERISKIFLKFLLDNGYLNKIPYSFNPYKIRKGKVPRGFDIHHIVPLSGGGSNSLTNLCLIERSFHKFLNKRCFDPALKHIQEGETIEINIPDLPPVALYKDFLPFINEVMNNRTKSSGFKRIIMAPLRPLSIFRNWKK